MYLEKHYLLPATKYQSLTAAGYYQILTEHFHYLGDTSSMRIAVLSFGYFCKYFSIEELLSYLSFPSNNANMLRPRINDYVKDGYLYAYSLDHTDNTTTTVYYLSEKGYHYIAPFFATDIKPDYKRRGKPTEVMHSYSTGINFFALLSSPYMTQPFTWQTETMLTGANKGSRNALCADAYVRTGNHNIYIEEDLLNESNGILIHKFESYAIQGFMDRTDDMILLSCKQPYYYITSPGYSRSGLKEVSAYLQSHPQQGLFDLSEDDLSGSGKKALSSLKEILIRYHHDRASRFDRQDLDRYINELDGKRNPYRIASYNGEQEKIARQKLYSLSGSYRTLHKNVTRDTRAYYCFLSGFPLYVVPTTLLGNHLYMLFRESGIETLVYQSLCHYFPEMAAGCQTVSPLLPVKHNHASMRLRNCFSSDHGYVCIEFASIDLGALIRAYHFFESVDISHRETPYHLVLVVETYQDAARFCRDTGYRQAFTALGLSDMTISFLLRRDLGRRERMFFLPTADESVVNYYDEAF